MCLFLPLNISYAYTHTSPLFDCECRRFVGEYSLKKSIWMLLLAWHFASFRHFDPVQLSLPFPFCIRATFLSFPLLSSFTYHARSCSFLLHVPLDAPLSFKLAGLVSLSYQLTFEFTIATEVWNTPALPLSSLPCAYLFFFPSHLNYFTRGLQDLKMFYSQRIRNIINCPSFFPFVLSLHSSSSSLSLPATVATSSPRQPPVQQS